MQRLHISITGQVQGVGFRPHVYRIARQLNLTGCVKNNPSGVSIEVQGLSATDFVSQLTRSLPPLARIDNIQIHSMALSSQDFDFQIIASTQGIARAMIAPDTCICQDCLYELFDPTSRYYHYPFLNCTNCGPRLTITRKLPYDRNQTSLDNFPLCDDCQADYSDPNNRRYHAQPTACATCGPQLSATIKDIAQALSIGKIVALKGLGGYQLLCDARNEAAIQTLRQRKHRDAKPFAIMVANRTQAQRIAYTDEAEQALLTSPARPIVLLKQRDKTLAKSIAPGLSHQGVMLPSTPLHYLLFDALALDVLIVTSANLAGNPLIIDDKEARHELQAIADVIVTHNRDILTRADDSVCRVINNAPMFIRRARGYAPESIKLPFSIPSTLALGGSLKNTFCITRGDEAFVSQHIGNLTNRASIEFFHESITYWLRFLDVKLERIACDLHPDFYTTQWAYDYNLPIIPVQHHHAHIASVATEYQVLKPALGLALDGYGYGSDGEAWGGELFFLENNLAQRLGSLLPIPQPGGDIAAREPWRMAASILHVLGKTDDIVERFSDKPQAARLAELLTSQVPMPLTSSCGRWFDAASAILGISTISRYEGDAAQQLESLVTQLDVLPNGWYVENDYLNLLPIFDYLCHANPVKGANIFHGTLIAGLTEWIVSWAKTLATDVVLLSGGCFLNKVLSEGLSKQLRQHNLSVYLPQRLPPGDGGISLGQAWVAGMSF